MSYDNTIVSACDEGYVWGVWLLLASIRRSGMVEPVLIGAYNWSSAWKEDILKFPGVELAELPITDRRSVTCSKPEIMLHAKTGRVTWLDCDGYLTGDCSAALDGPAETVNIRLRTPPEVTELYRKSRCPGEAPGEIPASILGVWQRDVAGLAEPRYRRSASAGVIGLSLPRYRGFLERWRGQMQRVLPADVAVVADGNAAYFQTDDSVLNSLLLFDREAPEVMPGYTADHLDKPHFVHFGFNPKPWVMWNRHSFRHFDAVMDIVEWAVAQGYGPRVALPYTFRRENKRLCQVLSWLSKPVSKWRKYKRKIFG